MSEEECTNHPDADQGPTSLDSEEYDEFLALSDNELGTTQAEGPWCFADSGRSQHFQCIHKPPVKFKSPHRHIFIEGAEIELEITSFERSVTTHVLNPNLYTISLKHGDFQWTIKKRYKDILNLHQQLRLFRASLNIPLPSKSHREQRHSFKSELNKEKEKGNKDKKKDSRRLPRFPSRPEVLISYEQIETRATQLEDYLRNLLSIRLYREHYETAQFFEVSELSFIGDLGSKGREGMVKKRTRSVYPGSSGCNFFGCYDSGCCVKCHFLCSDVCAAWRTRWLIVKDNFVAYIKPKDGRVKAVLLFDAAFDVSSGVFATGYRKGLQIMNLSRQIIISCPTKRTAREWQTFIKETVRKEGGDFTQRNRYFSFCPVRTLVRASWLVDGRAYMSAVATALDQAKQEIFIADWWLSPEIYMKRPGQADYWRLDVILKRKAASGVKVFVLLYKEVEVAIGINSFYSKQTLISESDNIKVLRHPDHAKAGIFLWAHHEKMVVIDQSLAFVGGIDLCYGRWDDHCHRLTDLGPVSDVKTDNSSEQSAATLLPMATNALNLSVLALSTKNENGGVHYSSEVEECGDLVMQPSPENIKCNTPEMEKKSIFDSVKSKGRDFIQMLSFTGDDSDSTDKDKEEKESPDASIAQPPEEDSLIEIAQDPSLGAHLEQSTKLWLGKDYVNFIVKDFDRLDLPFQDLVDRTKTPRMPWHDVGVMLQGSAARDLARHFIQRWNAVKLEKSKLNPHYPYLLPKSYQEYSQFEIPGIRPYDVSCQVVRSISHWSGGFIDQDTWEASIHEAIVDAIAKSRHYIYIENQFFITCGSPQVKNQVSDALFKRILRAHREKTVFRVFVILPLLPGFEGEVGTSRGTALHAITHWNYVSICRGKDALIIRLKAAGVADPEEYITFNGLRNHAILKDKPVTELIYVHSKLLITDDRLMICGSANINDRSLLGKRDSEIGVVIEDETFVDGTMNGSKFLSGRMCGSLRRYLFREHLGLLDSPNPSVNVKDPISSEFYNDVWRATAIKNTAIYDKVFQCLPRDEVKSFKDITRASQPSLNILEPSAALLELESVQGHLVMFPLDFLKSEVLTPTPSTVQGMMPTSLWT